MSIYARQAMLERDDDVLTAVVIGKRSLKDIAFFASSVTRLQAGDSLRRLIKEDVVERVGRGEYSLHRLLAYRLRTEK